MGRAGFVLAGGRNPRMAPVAARGGEPLRAIYHARVAAAAKRALHYKLLKMQDFLRTIDTEKWRAGDCTPIGSEP